MHKNPCLSMYFAIYVFNLLKNLIVQKIIFVRHSVMMSLWSGSRKSMNWSHCLQSISLILKYIRHAGAYPD